MAAGAERNSTTALQRKERATRIRLTILVLILFAVVGFVSSKMYVLLGGSFDPAVFQKSITRFDWQHWK